MAPFPLPPSKRTVGGRGQDILPANAHHVAESSLFLHEEIARVDIAIVLDDQILVAVLGHVAIMGGLTQKSTQQRIEKPDGNPAHMGWIPLVEDFTQEFAPLGPVDRERKEGTVSVKLDTGDVLLEKTSLVQEVLIDLPGFGNIHPVNQHQHIEGHPGRTKKVDALPNFTVRTCSISVPAISVMDGLGTIHTDAHKKSVAVKEHGKLPIKECGIGLNAVGDHRAVFAMFLLKLDDPSEKAHSHQQRFTALPAKPEVRLFRGHVRRDHPR